MREKPVTIILLLFAMLSFCTPTFSQKEEKMRVAALEFDENGEVGDWEMVQFVLRRPPTGEQSPGTVRTIDQETVVRERRE